jgi:arabinofuranosyltransferase
VIIVFFQKGNRRLISAAAGIPLYLIYLLRIGGDFMGGRYFALPLLCSLALISRIQFPKMKLSWAVVLVGLISIVSFQAHLITPVAENIFLVNQGNWDKSIGDERLFYAPGTSITSLKNRIWELTEMGEMNRFEWPYFQFRAEGEQLAQQGGNNNHPVFVSDSIGFRGFFAGPNVTLIDVYALADPLLARLPVTNPTHLRVGHMERAVPPGYIDSVQSGRNQIQDPQTAALYDKLLIVTRGDLFTSQRWQMIWEMNKDHFLP